MNEAYRWSLGIMVIILLSLSLIITQLTPEADIFYQAFAIVGLLFVLVLSLYIHKNK